MVWYNKLVVIRPRSGIPRSVYPQRNAEFLPLRCAQNDTRRACPERSEGARNDTVRNPLELHHQLRLRNVRELQFRHPAFVHLQSDAPCLKSCQPSLEDLLLAEGLAQHHAGATPGEVLEVAWLRKLPVQAGRGHFQDIRPRKGVLHVQDDAYLLADVLTVRVRHSVRLVNVDPQKGVRAATLQLDVDPFDSFGLCDPLRYGSNLFQVNQHRVQVNKHLQLNQRASLKIDELRLTMTDRRPPIVNHQSSIMSPLASNKKVGFRP